VNFRYTVNEIHEALKLRQKLEYRHVVHTSFPTVPIGLVVEGLEASFLGGGPAEVNAVVPWVYDMHACSAAASSSLLRALAAFVPWVIDEPGRDWPTPDATGWARCGRAPGIQYCNRNGRILAK
jgi:hypothetical protein